MSPLFPTFLCHSRGGRLRDLARKGSRSQRFCCSRRVRYLRKCRWPSYPFDAVAKPLAAGVEVVEPAAGQRAVGVDDRGGLTDDAITFVPAGHAVTDCDNRAAELMAEDDRIVDRPGMVAGPLVEIAAADADIGDLEQHIVRADFGNADFTEFDRAAISGKVDDSGWHRGVPGRQLLCPGTLPLAGCHLCRESDISFRVSQTAALAAVGVPMVLTGGQSVVA